MARGRQRAALEVTVKPSLRRVLDVPQHLSYADYPEHVTRLLSLKMAHEQPDVPAARAGGQPRAVGAAGRVDAGVGMGGRARGGTIVLALHGQRRERWGRVGGYTTGAELTASSGLKSAWPHCVFCVLCRVAESVAEFFSRVVARGNACTCFS